MKVADDTSRETLECEWVKACLRYSTIQGRSIVSYYHFSFVVNFLPFVPGLGRARHDAEV